MDKYNANEINPIVIAKSSCYKVNSFTFFLRINSSSFGDDTIWVSLMKLSYVHLDVFILCSHGRDVVDGRKISYEWTESKGRLFINPYKT